MLQISDAREKRICTFENIEAEIVFKLKEKGSWPKYQSEIHFYSEIDFHSKIEVQLPKTSEEVFGIALSDVASTILENLKNYVIQRTQ